MMSSLPSVFHCTLLEREVSRDDCHECRLGTTCAGIPSRLMLINHAPVGPTSGPQYPPTFRESARVGVSGQREISAVEKPPKIGMGVFSSVLLSPMPTPSVQNPTAPQARRGE